jgi:DNA-binding transcriptional MerR regulator
MAALTVSELSVRTGVPVSTIHHYRQRGLLPAPHRAGGHRLRYGDEHVRALRLIRRLRERRGLALERIAEILPQLLATEQEAFRPAMWDRLLGARASADPNRAALVAVAVAEFSSRSFEEVTVGELCVATGIGKHTFYRYFDTKEAAFVAAAGAAADQVVVAISTPAGGTDLAGALRVALAPVLPLLLELATKASRGSPPFLTTATQVFAAIVEALDTTAPIAAAGDSRSGVELLADVSRDLVVSRFGGVR